MQKLDPIQISWIIKSKEDGAKNAADVASSMKISVRWVQKLYSRRYRRTGAVPILGKPRRPKGIITEQMVQTVQSTFEKFRCSAVFLEKIIDTAGTHIPHNTIHKIMRDEEGGGQKLSQRRGGDKSGLDMKGHIQTPCGILTGSS